MNNIETALPSAVRDWALFLDIDGTLLDIAPTPEAVEVPSDLAAKLEAASAWLGGALAVVSGRSLASIDQLLLPLKLPCAAEHGAVLRLPDGMLHHTAPGALPDHWADRICTVAAAWPGVLIDAKSHGLALHYRLAPEREQDVRRLLNELIREEPDFEILPAKMALELRRRGLHKGAAVRAFMAVSPFAGRRPVFVGDDVTDEDGFTAARDHGGLGLSVLDVFGGAPSQVRAWLRRFRD